MYAGDEFYDDDITSGPLEPPLRFSSVPTPVRQDDAEGTAPSSVPSAPFSIFWINNDGRIEGHAEHGTFAYTGSGWVFRPLDHPSWPPVPVVTVETLLWLNAEAMLFDAAITIPRHLAVA